MLKFQDKVTIFVVGCHANIAENFILLQQVNDVSVVFTIFLFDVSALLI